MDFNQLMKQAQALQARMGEMQAKVADVEAQGSSGGGMVQATITGKGELRGLRIDPSLMVPGETAILEDLIVAAVNDAKRKVEAKLQEEMAKIAGDLKLPPGFKLPGT